MKRIFDITISLVLFILFLPLMGLIAALIRIKLGSPVIFKQTRPGLNGKPFMMYKFRTLTNEKDSSGMLLPDSKRMTRFGDLLRKSSLDELPELMNVIRGEMSLVGPRPLLMQYLERYNPEQAQRHRVKPGLTGWAQVNGRNALDWTRKFELDVWYVNHQHFWLDVKILFLTLIQVVKRDGISQKGHATAEEFMGNTEHE
jgi:sugar transferase EpsL